MQSKSTVVLLFMLCVSSPDFKRQYNHTFSPREITLTSIMKSRKMKQVLENSLNPARCSEIEYQPSLEVIKLVNFAKISSVINKSTNNQV